MQLLQKLRRAGEQSASQGSTWRVVLSAEMLKLLREIWNLPSDKVVEVLEKAYFVRVNV